MNKDITKLILIVGLIYISVTQKKQSTRNIMLLITALLGFCMYTKVEGYCMIPPENFNREIFTSQDPLPPDNVVNGISEPDYYAYFSGYDGEGGVTVGGASPIFNNPADLTNNINTFLKCQPPGFSSSLPATISTTNMSNLTEECSNTGELAGEMVVPDVINDEKLVLESDNSINCYEENDSFPCDTYRSLEPCAASERIDNTVSTCNTNNGSCSNQCCDNTSPSGEVQQELGAICTTPSNPAYDLSVDAISTGSGSSDSFPKCNTGYYGEAPTATCPTGGGDYVLEGCQECPAERTFGRVATSGTGTLNDRCGGYPDCLGSDLTALNFLQTATISQSICDTVRELPTNDDPCMLPDGAISNDILNAACGDLPPEGDEVADCSQFQCGVGFTLKPSPEQITRVGTTELSNTDCCDNSISIEERDAAAAVAATEAATAATAAANTAAAEAITSEVCACGVVGDGNNAFAETPDNKYCKYYEEQLEAGEKWVGVNDQGEEYLTNNYGDRIPGRMCSDGPGAALDSMTVIDVFQSQSYCVSPNNIVCDPQNRTP